MNDEIAKLVTSIYGIFHEQEVTMLEAFVATLSIACSVARGHDMSKENFLKECEQFFADGEKVDKMNFTIN